MSRSMFRSMLKAISSRRRLQRWLPWTSVGLALLVCPAMASAQEAQNAGSAAASGVTASAVSASSITASSVTASSVSASSATASSVSALNSPFDELNSRLGDTAERLAAAPLSGPAARVTAIGTVTSRVTQDVTPEKIAPVRSAITQEPQRGAQTASRVERLRPVIDPILRGQGIPAELVAVALVESGGQAAAISPKGARGVWQLMPATARRYGLVVSGQRDDRLDLVSATQAAARYLHDLHAQFGDWELVLAAYNAGEQAVQNAIQRGGSNSFAVLSQLRLLPPETRNYVPAVMGARGLFKQGTSATSESNPAAVGTNNPRNLSKGNVFFAMNAPSIPQLAADGDE